MRRICAFAVDLVGTLCCPSIRLYSVSWSQAPRFPCVGRLAINTSSSFIESTTHQLLHQLIITFIVASTSPSQTLLANRPSATLWLSCAIHAPSLRHHWPIHLVDKVRTLIFVSSRVPFFCRAHLSSSIGFTSCRTCHAPPNGTNTIQCH